MKTIAILSVCILSSCVHPSSTTISVKDAQGSPVWNFPLRIELSDGLVMSDGSSKVNGDFDLHKARKDIPQSIIVRTDKNGFVEVPYFIRGKQPSKFRQMYFGAEEIADQAVSVTPMEDLPKSSKISVSFPNP